MNPEPVTAWLTLVFVALGIITGVVGGVAGLWTVVAKPQIRDMARTVADERDKAHAALHEDLDQRLEAESRAREASIRRAHSRIDHVHGRVDGLTTHRA